MQLYASLPIRSSFLPNELDGVQTTLATLINPNMTDESFAYIITTLWFIWKARNELWFRNKKCSVLQVYQAARAHMHTDTAELVLSKEHGLQNTGSDQGRPGEMGPSAIFNLCFTDATNEQMKAALGIYFLDPSCHQNIYVKAQVQICSSVG